MNRRLQSLAATLGGGLAALLIVASTNVFADGNPDTDNVPRLVPFQGTLEHEGTPWDGPVTLVFRVYDDPNGIHAVWEETQEVTAYAGRFSVLLGATSPTSSLDLETALKGSDTIELAVAIAEVGEPEVVLSNRQRFLPVPYAAWSTTSTRFDIASELVINGDGHVPTPGDVGSVSISDPGGLKMVVDSNDINSAGELMLNAQSGQSITIGGDLRMYKDLKIYGSRIDLTSDTPRTAMLLEADEVLHINGDDDFDAVTFDSATHVVGPVTADATTVKGKLTIDSGGLNVTGAASFSGGVTFDANVSGLAVTVTQGNCITIDTEDYGSSESWVDCGTTSGKPRFIHEIQLRDHSNVGGDGTLIYDIKCCTLNATVK